MKNTKRVGGRHEIFHILMRMVSMSMSKALNTVIWLIAAINGIAITIHLIVLITVAELLIPHICINTWNENGKGNSVLKFQKILVNFVFEHCGWMLTIPGEQWFMSTTLNELPIFQYKDFIGLYDGRQSMGHDNCCTIRAYLW